jgi:predicted transcriptional regulator
MSTTDVKTDLHRLIDRVQDDAILQAVRTILVKQAEAETDFWNELPESDKKAIEEGLEQLDQGQSFSYEQVRNRVREKYNL